MSALAVTDPPLQLPATTKDLLAAMGVNWKREPRKRCLSIVQNGHRAADASAYDKMAANRILKPPPIPQLENQPSTAGAHVLQVELRRGIVSKERGNFLTAIGAAGSW